MFEQNLSLYRNLKTIKGISDKWANQICIHLGVNQNIIYKDLSDLKKEKLSIAISRLKRSHNIFSHQSTQQPKLILRNLDVNTKNSIEKLIHINSYRGKRLSLGLPSHGQRTLSNGRTAKKLRRRWSKV